MKRPLPILDTNTFSLSLRIFDELEKLTSIGFQFAMGYKQAQIINGRFYPCGYWCNIFDPNAVKDRRRYGTAEASGSLKDAVYIAVQAYNKRAKHINLQHEAEADCTKEPTTFLVTADEIKVINEVIERYNQFHNQNADINKT